ncbi:MAG TPA: slipin family protein [Thermoanaerobaculia bacterium]|jgi:regulator of protease activity HflC (stomatin/prohibitin superfamily)|nr:slipin family protein [Thermoanaerobaculia bacterium]
MNIPVVAKKRNKAREAEAPVKNNVLTPDVEVRGGARRYVNGVSFMAAFLVWIIGIGIAILSGRNDDARGAVVLLAATVVAVLVLFAIKIANQWERAVVLRFGKFRALRGPGLFVIIPVVDEVSHLIDQRVRVTDVTAESALTRDTVPVDVDAIVFWTVWDAQKCVLEVSDYFTAIALSAQTALREAIGRAELAAMITEREHIGAELRKILDEKTNSWGITVHSVEIRDVKIPQGLEDAMSRQAQAERERQARIILGTAETEIAARFVAAGAEYENRPVALHLRAMNMLYEAIKEKGAMVIVPSSAVETMGLGGLAGMTALGGGPPKVE